MKYLILLLALNACAHPSRTMDRGPIVQPSQSSTQEIPEYCTNPDGATDLPSDCECYDNDGKFDENLGHDTLDCGNL